MTTPDLERRIRTFFAEEIGADEAAPSSVYAFLGAIPQSMPREQGLLGRRAFGLLAAALLVGLVAGAIAVGSGVIKLPSILPSPSLVAEESTHATPSSSAAPSPNRPLGLVVYNVTELIQPPPDNCTPPNHVWCFAERIWIANADGSGAHQLLPQISESQHALAWTPDGSRILYQDSSCALRFADAEGVVLEALPLEILYPGVPADDRCGAFWFDNGPSGTGITFSPDGTRLAYVVAENGRSDVPTTIAIYNLETREVMRLDSTRVNDTGTCVTANEGFNASPMWSPDGTRLLFTRQPIGPRNEAGGCQTAVLVVNADGTDLRVIVPPGARRNALHARWSPDGSLIAYHYGEWDAILVDIFVVNPDGTGVRQLTTDGLSVGPEWTADGRIVFGRFPDVTSDTASELWMIDADGSNSTRLGTESLAELTAANCVVCPFSPEADDTVDALWQPLP